MKNIISKKNVENKGTKNKKKGKKVIAGICVLALVGAGVFTIIQKSSSGQQDVNATTQMSAQAQIGDVSTSITSSGTLEGKEEATVRVPADIKIKEVLVSEGDAVKKGTKLASVYPSSVAEVLLDVKDSIDTVEDKLDDLDEDEITDTSSDDYLKKLAYDQELSDLEDLEDQLQEILESGYITAESSGIVGTINVSDDTETGTTTGDSSSGITYTGSTSTESSYANVRTLSTSSMTASVRLLSSTGSDSESTSSLENITSSALSASEDSTEESTEDTTEEESSESSDSTESETDESTESESSSTEESSSDTSQDTDSSTSGGTSSTGSSTGSKSNKNNTTTDSSSSGKQNGFGQQGVSGGNSVTSGGSLAAGSTDSQTESDSIADIEMEKIFILNSSTQMLVTVSIDEADISSVQEGQTAEVTLTALSEETFEGLISDISNVSSSSGSSVKYQVEITIEKTDDMLTGMSASAVIYIEKAENVLLIPSAAIQEKEGKAYVYTQKDSDGNLSGETEVTTGLSDGSQVEIQSGLSEGDTVYYEIYSSGNSDNSSNDKDSNQMNFHEGGGFDGGGGNPGGMPGNAPSGGPSQGQ